MKLTVHGKNLQVTASLYEYTERKLGRLGTWLEEESDTHATLSVQGHKPLHVVEVTINCHGMVLRAEEKQDDMYTSIDLVADKLERQLRKLKEKGKRRLRQQHLPKADALELQHIENEEESFELARVKRFRLSLLTSRKRFSK